MDQKYGEFVGVDKLMFARVIKDDETGYLTEAPRYLAPTAEIAGEPEIANKTTYYDNAAANNFVTEGKTELKLVVSNVFASLYAELIGKNYDTTSGRVYDSGKAEPPEYAIGYRFEMGNGNYRYYWFLKGNFSGGAEEATSRTNDVDIKNYTLTYTAVSTTKRWVLPGQEDEKPLKRVFGDTSDPKFNPSGWFDNVQVPDATQPPQLSLVSLPVDDATGIDVNAVMTLTFNNMIDTYAITLLNEDTSAFVPATYALNATGKIVTIKPIEPMDTGDSYSIYISEAVDVFGQTLADIINFTTA